MMHGNRRHRVVACTTIFDIVHRLVSTTWTACSGFRWRSLTLVNDSTSEDALQEYAVIRHGRQIESLTVSWMDERRLIETLVNLETITFPVIDLGPLEVREYCDGSCQHCA